MNWTEIGYQAITGVATYLLSRAIARVDSHFKDISSLREELGKLKMINEAQWREIEKLKTHGD